MAQDPEQAQNIDDEPDPQFPYGATPQAASAPPSYISPEFYAVAAQPSAPEQPPLGYTVPTPSAYAAPQMQYGIGSNYGHEGATQGYGYGAPLLSAPQPQATPLPFGEAIRQLPAQYWRVIRRPSSATFAAEMGKARWNVVWVQIAFYIVVVTLLGFLSNLIVQGRAETLSTTGSSTLTPETLAITQRLLTLLSFISTYGQIFLIPLSLFVGTGLLFLLAKAFGGKGRFLPQLYSTLLFIVPLGLIMNTVTLLLSLVPTVGTLFNFLVIFGYLGYEGTLLGFMLMPVHRLSSGRAVGAVVALFGVVLLLSCVLGFVVAILLTASLRLQ
ncbi:MAG: hypothetical protein NVS4B12_25570 [Ktedonobacteraceae bacterium]